MNPNRVVLIAFMEFDNLGVGYLASVIAEKGFEPVIIDFRDGKEKILRAIIKNDPLLVGFSVIFQYYINDFRDLIIFLRESGIKSHFTAGGQYASMRYAELFNLIPSLDSIVRFEGEYTFLDLVYSLYRGTDWKEIRGLVFKKKVKLVVNLPHPPEMDLNKFPYPVRSPLKEYVLGEKYSTLIAGRGCLNNCSFCNNSEYLKQFSVRTKRVRSPENVTGEIEYLHNRQNCSVFLFEDDDFPLGKVEGFDWPLRFCKELTDKGISDKIMWKINCRPDEVDYESFALMKNHGLFLVFLGIDDGTDQGLARLNKHMTVKESLRGIEILKKLWIDFDYGFMLFQPSSTFSSVDENLTFLRDLCSDGYTPAIFLRMMPFFGTRVERELEREGRLKGDPGCKTYDFLEAPLNNCFDAIMDCFGYWLYDSEGLVNILRWARNYISVFSRFYKPTTEILSLSSEIRMITSESNLYMFDVTNELLEIFETSGYKSSGDEVLSGYKQDSDKKQHQYREQVIRIVKRICHIAEFQDLRYMIR